MKIRTLILAISTLAIFASSLSGCVVVPDHGHDGPHFHEHDYDRRW